MTRRRKIHVTMTPEQASIVLNILRAQADWSQWTNSRLDPDSYPPLDIAAETGRVADAMEQLILAVEDGLDDKMLADIGSPAPKETT